MMMGIKPTIQESGLFGLCIATAPEVLGAVNKSRPSHLHLLRNLKRIIHLDAQVANGAFNFGMTK